MTIWMLIGLVFVFLVGYIIGKHQGWAEGSKAAEATVPLQIRERSLEEGKCLICSETWSNLAKYEKVSRDLDNL